MIAALQNASVLWSDDRRPRFGVRRCFAAFTVTVFALSMIEFTKSAVSERGAALLPEFREAIGNVPPEAGFGGIWESEMFLFFAAVKPCEPRQILESGRARGKSTSILACCFP